MLRRRATAVPGLARAGRRLGAAVLLALLCACANQLQVRSLATARADQAAYELAGGDPAVLRQEALRLCPQGSEILREAVQGRRPEPSDMAWQRWTRASSEWFEPARRSAQLTVVCLASPRGAMLAATQPAAAAASAAPAVPADAATSLGPAPVTR